MGFRMRKSLKIAPGVRLSVSKSGVGASVGGKGARYSAHSSGRRTTTLGSGVVPGAYYQKSSGSGARARDATQQVAPPSPKKPGLFAPKGEKELYKAVKAQDVKAIKQVGISHEDFRVPSYSLAGLMMLTSEPTEAEQLLSEAFAPGKDPAEDKLLPRAGPAAPAPLVAAGWQSSQRRCARPRKRKERRCDSSPASHMAGCPIVVSDRQRGRCGGERAEDEARHPTTLSRRSRPESAEQAGSGW